METFMTIKDSSTSTLKHRLSSSSRRRDQSLWYVLHVLCIVMKLFLISSWSDWFLLCFSQGVINKIAVGHLGCLVHGCFNACVVKPSQLTPEQWRDCGLRAGESVEFEVFQLDSDCAGVLIIRGRLEKSRFVFETSWQSHVRCLPDCSK